MSEDATGAAEAQGADAAEPQGGATQAHGATVQAQGASTGDGSGTVDVEALTAKLAALERDNAKYRREIKGFQDASLSEAERMSAENSELKAKVADHERTIRDQSVRAAAQDAASKLGFRSPALAYRLLDRDAIDFGEDGAPRNVEKLLTDVAKADPYLLSGADFGGGQRGRSAAGPDMNDLIRRAAGRT